MKKILIIEDDLSVASRLRTRLAAEFEVEIAADGQSGYYSISEWKPNFVVLDVTIQQMTPRALIGKIRAQKQFEKIGFFLLADTLPHEIVDDALVAGATDAFSKEDPNFIEHVFQAIIGHSRATLARYTGKVAAPRFEAPTSQTSFTPRATAAITPPEDAGECASVAHLVSNVNETRNVAVISEESEQLRQLFAQGFSAKVHAARQALVVYMTAKDSALRASSYERFYKTIVSLRAEAAQCELTGLLRILDPLEQRSKQLRENLDDAPAASRQVLASAIDFMTTMNNQVSELPALNRLSPVALVVDDESVSRKAISLGLEKAQIRVTAVDSGEAAIRECEVSCFDLILLDVEMPGMNGFAVCARIRAMPNHRDTPILFISALDDLRSRASTKISGGNQFITKPVNFLELSITATSLLLKQCLKEIDKAVLSEFKSRTIAVVDEFID